MQMFILFLSIILHLTQSQEIIPPYAFLDCKHLILPPRCQCYHSGYESQLRCLKSELHSLPKLPNSMRWNALDFSYNYITSVDNYVFADIYVEKINLKSNYLRQIEITAFDQIKNLKQLYINHNQLKEFYPQTLISPGSSLEIFDISHNPLKYLDLGEILLNLPMLKQFHLVSCHLTNPSIYTLLKLIETSTDEYNQTITRNGHYYLEILDLSSNNLTKICHNLFDGLFNLRELRLERNSIRLIDNNFLRSFQQIRFLNLAENSLEHVPKLSSQTLEILNFSSNSIHYISDYFAANLPSIRMIDFDYNLQLNHTTSRAFCFLNINSLEKLTFRSNNLVSLNTFNEFLCRLKNYTNKNNLIDINHNINLKCNCTLIQFERYLLDYNDLSCTQQGQDRFYVSTLTNWFSNCIDEVCEKKHEHGFCSFIDAERVVYEGTCEAKIQAIEQKKQNRTKLTSTISTITIQNQSESQNFTTIDNTTRYLNEKISKSNTICKQMNIYLLFMILFTFFVDK